jgi:hypothetical protein
VLLASWLPLVYFYIKREQYRNSIVPQTSVFQIYGMEYRMPTYVTCPYRLILPLKALAKFRASGGYNLPALSLPVGASVFGASRNILFQVGATQNL